MNYRLPVGFVTLLIAVAGCSGVANLPSGPANQAAFSPAVPVSGRTVRSRPGGSANFQVVYTFQDSADGGNPFAGLTVDRAGNLYGTTSSGGSGYGTAFELKNTAKGYKYVVLHTFAGGSDGANPYARLMPGAGGKLYGTTVNGGGGAGTLFELLPGKAPRTERVLYAFTQSVQGANPSAGDLTIDSKGAIYGTTQYGGTYGQGTVFKLSPAKGADKEKVLYSFGANSNDGTQPYAGVTLDRAGNIYGTTALGGQGYGAVFELTPSKSGWTEQIIHTFGNVTDGGTPYAGLSFDAQGNLFGATTQGPGSGGGTFFELTPSNGTWSFNTIYSLSGWGISGNSAPLTSTRATISLGPPIATVSTVPGRCMSYSARGAPTTTSTCTISRAEPTDSTFSAIRRSMRTATSSARPTWAVPGTGSFGKFGQPAKPAGATCNLDCSGLNVHCHRGNGDL